jgi:hypothetical protein
MGRLEREAAQRRSRHKLDAMKRRAGLLRRRVVAIATVAFVLLWTVVFVQMATGNDPVLGTSATRSGAKKGSAAGTERRRPRDEVPPPSEAEDGESPAVGEREAADIEAEQAEVERDEAEQIEIEQREAEARELEELEPLTTGQS